MIFLIVMLLSNAYGLINCNPNLCPPQARGDGNCDINCMTSYCGFDSGSNWSPGDSPQKSDCYYSCLGQLGYASKELGDGNCNSEWDTPSCGYDFGDCSYCGTECQENQLNGTCNSACNVPGCYYAENVCRECSPGCNSTIWGDGNCDSECSNSQCNYDNGDCLNLTCAENCFIWMVGNSICDQACDNEECEYDKKDCGCTPECSNSIWGDGVCDEECNNLDCEFDKGDCGHCSSGCTIAKLSNQKCDPECNTANCEWDYGICGCSEFCAVEDYGKCNPECLVGECNYDQMSSDSEKRCKNQELIWFTVYQQIIRNDTSSIVSFDDCWEASSHKCNLTMALDKNECHPECFIPECNYGLCHTSSLSDCQSNLPADAQNLCNFCTFSSEISSSSCSLCLNSSLSSLNLFGFSFCYSNPEIKTFIHYPVSYFTSKEHEDQNNIHGSGTIEDPFFNLKTHLKAFTSNCNLKIYMLINDGTYKIDNGWSFRFCNLYIFSLDESKVTWKIKGWFAWDAVLQKNVTFENIIFDGSGFNDVDCTGFEYCEYVWYSTFNETDRYYYSDRGDRVSMSNPTLYGNGWNSMFRCENCTLTLRNTDIKNWRFQTTAIIKGEGSVKLINVNFDNFWVDYQGTAAILLSSSSSNSNPAFTYVGGLVSRLNNGYEFGDPWDFRGFLHASGPYSVRIENVDFKYNLAYRKPQSSVSEATLIYLESPATVKLSNCTFMYNYFETGLIQIYMSVSASQYKVNASDYINYLELNHIVFEGLTFKSNYADSSFIYIHYSNYLLNFALQDISFELNGALEGPLINLDNYAMLEEYKRWTTKQITNQFGKVINATIAPRWCKIKNLNFTKNYAQGMFKAGYMANFLIKDAIFDANGSSDDSNNINTLVLDYFVKNDDIYIRKEKESPGSIDCEWLASISNSYSLDISFINLTNNICRASSPTFSIVESDTKEITSINCDSNYGEGAAPTCLLITGAFERNLAKSTFSNNQNTYFSGNGAIQIKDSQSSSIINCTFFNNTGNIGAAASFSGMDLLIDSSTFDLNSSPSGYGVSIYTLFSESSDQKLFKVSSSTFANGFGLNGGAIYIAQALSQNSIELIISDSLFSGNAASYGSSIYLDRSVSLHSSSNVIDCQFLESRVGVSGSISLYNSGTLKFKDCKFIKNAGPKGAAFYANFRNSTNSKLIFDSCTFENNQGDSIVFSDNPSSSTQIVTQFCTFEYNTGSMFYIIFDSLSDTGSIFRHNSADSSCIHLQNSANLELISTLFLNNTSSSMGGAISLRSKSYLTCSFCTFTANLAQSGFGGALYAEEDSVLNISYSLFSKNVGESDGDAIYIFNAKNSTISSSKFFDHLSKGSVIYLMSSDLEVSFSRIYKNSSPGIKLIMSTIKIESSEITDQVCTLGCSVCATLESQVHIINSKLHDGNSTKGGGAIYSSQSSIYLQSSSFSQLISASGASIYVAYDSNLEIKDCQFLDINSFLDGIIYAYQASILIENSYFNSFIGSGLYGSQLTSLEIKDSHFTAGNGTLGGSVYCLNCEAIYLTDCSFTENYVDSLGGALYIATDNGNTKKSSCEISNCLFERNTGGAGGAIYVKDITLAITSSQFTNNKADFLASEKKNYGQAGGVYMSCSNANYCDFKLESCDLTENSASLNGGGIYFDNEEPSLKNNIFKDNSAIYGKDVASYPVKLMVANEDGTLAENFNGRALSQIPISTFNLTDVASGQKSPKPLLIALVDTFNQIVSSDSESIGEIEPISSAIVDGIIKVTAVNGIFNFSSYTVSAEPETDVQIKVFSSSIDISKALASDSSSSQSLYINAKMRSCRTGEVKTGNLCKVCPQGYYSLDTSSTACLACPAAAVCYGSYRMSPKSGYWRDNPYTDQFWKCPNPSACLGSPDADKVSYTGVCSKGYKGNKCQSCQENYSRSLSSRCKECPSLALNIFIIVAIFCLFIIIAFLLVRSIIKSALKPTALAPVYLKIFLNYIQLVNIASNFDLNWPSEVIELFYVQNGVDYVYQQIYSFECLLKEDHGSDTYFKTLIIIAAFPAIAFFIAFIIWIFIKAAQKSHKNFWDDFISTCIIILFLIHPTIVKKLLGSFNCTEINSGEFWLKEDLSIRCWELRHVFYILAVTIPALIVWGIFFPVICLINIIRQRKMLEHVNVKLRYGFLFRGFKPKQYFWEFVILYGKLLLVCCSVFLTVVNIKIQALIAAALLLLFWDLQYENKPYIEDSLNNTELAAKTVCVITIFSGLFYLTGSLGDTAKTILFIFIFIANIYFVAYWFFKLFKFSIPIIIEKIKKLFKGTKVMPISNPEVINQPETLKNASRNQNFSISSIESLQLKTLDLHYAAEQESLPENFDQEKPFKSALTPNQSHGEIGDFSNFECVYR
ncbi:unnamed protein product [Blepharisma stoltei]|uniref:LNR domain-containing protein n=1 Tax=Blepharisma stoltei TaxID=1481888 RepID=A0AAU9IY23_9CILI|nr:unnamed protein product [Blepharisma stoltei]